MFGSRESRRSSRPTVASSTRSSSRCSGRLRYRTSYGQNVLKHTLEVVHLAGIMAAELGASVKTARRAALLHDIGKAMTHEVEGTHAALSAQMARRYGEAEGVVHAVEAHHYEVQPQTVEAVLLIAADAISASRPGARGESLEHYIKRLSALEDLASVKPGVAKAYALQAGREIRVIVEPTEVDDDTKRPASTHEIAREIEDQLQVSRPGEGDRDPREPFDRDREVGRRPASVADLLSEPPSPLDAAIGLVAGRADHGVSDPPARSTGGSSLAGINRARSSTAEHSPRASTRPGGTP